MSFAVGMIQRKRLCHSILNGHQLEHCSLTRVSAPYMLLTALIVIVTIWSIVIPALCIAAEPFATQQLSFFFYLFIYIFFCLKYYK